MRKFYIVLLGLQMAVKTSFAQMMWRCDGVVDTGVGDE
jgi:hypothetical protein